MIDKAIEACKSSNQIIEDNFVGGAKMVGIGSKVEYKIISESQKKKQEIVSGVVMKALRRLKGN